MKDKHLYKFRDFTLSSEENVLRLNGKPLALTPKMLEVLQVLIKNYGQIVGKEELMKAVWADSFVEDNNLTFTINQLRKILGDNAHNPVFIETVPRRGYRFIADVEMISESGKDDNSPVLPVNIKPFFSPKRLLIALIFVILLGGIIFIGSFYGWGKGDAPILTAPFSAEKLSTDGKVLHAVISPDGKTVVYSSKSGKNKESLWLRELENDTITELIAPSENLYLGLAFAPDGNSIYFSRIARGFVGQADIYRISIFGGIPNKIINQAQGWIDVSPDGTKVSFVRCPRLENENCSLWIADSANGGNERKLVVQPSPFSIRANSFSPDGKRIAFAFGQSENSANEFGLSEIDLETAQERELTNEKFFNIKSIEYLPNQNGLLITTRKSVEKNFRIWKISGGGESLPLTNDAETYGDLSLDKAAAKIVSIQIKQDFNLRLLSAENPNAGLFLANALAARFAPDGRIVFTSQMSGNDEIWSMNADGSNQKQLTNDKALDSRPIAAPDNNSIFFSSNRTGSDHIWRMNSDGSYQTQITHREGGFPISISPDGEWLYYHHGINRTLWRVSLKTGEEQSVSKKVKFRFAVSPDAQSVAFSDPQGDERVLIVASLADGQIIKTFRTVEKKMRIIDIVWLPDGKHLAYITCDSDFENNILWQQSFEQELPIQIAALGDEKISEVLGLAVSPDSKNFAIVQGGWRHDAVLLKGLR